MSEYILFLVHIVYKILYYLIIIILNSKLKNFTFEFFNIKKLKKKSKNYFDSIPLYFLKLNKLIKYNCSKIEEHFYYIKYR